MRMKKLSALLLAVVFLVCLVPAAVQAEDGWVLEELEKEDASLEPIPLLVIKINYDADGDGKLTDKDRVVKGTQQHGRAVDAYHGFLLERALLLR